MAEVAVNDVPIDDCFRDAIARAFRPNATSEFVLGSARTGANLTDNR